MQKEPENITVETASAIADMLKSGNLDKAMQAMTTLIEGCLNDPESQENVHYQGLVGLVVPFLEAWDRPQVQLRAATCTASFTSNSVFNRIGMVKYGTIAIFVRMLSLRQVDLQEAACNTIINLVKRPSDDEQSYIDDIFGDSAVREYHLAAQEELNRFGGVETLCRLMEQGHLKVKSAAAAAVANAMTCSHPTRVAFQEAKGVERCLLMMRHCDEAGAVCNKRATRERGRGIFAHVRRFRLLVHVENLPPSLPMFFWRALSGRNMQRWRCGIPWWTCPRRSRTSGICKAVRRS